MVVVLLLEGGFTAWNYFASDKTIPQELVKRYQSAIEDTEQLTRRNAVVSQAIAEDRNLVKIVDTLAFIRPNDIKLTKLEVDIQGNIIIEGFSSDSRSFNMYVSRINEEKNLFHNARLDRYTGVETGTIAEYQQFTIHAKSVK